MSYYTSSFTGSGMQMIPYNNSAPRSSASRGSHSSSPPESYYGNSPNSSASSYSGSRAPQRAPTDISTTSVQTMGNPNRPGYVGGQAPADYFYDDAAKMKWDALSQARQRRMMPPSTRIEDLYQSPRRVNARSWAGDDDIVPEDSVSNVGSVRSGGGTSERLYYSSASQASKVSESDRRYAHSRAMRSGFGYARTQVANGRRVCEVVPE